VLLKDLALLMLDTGLRVREAVSLKWVDAHVDPVGGARFGYLQIHDGKTDNAKRTVSLTERVVKMLKRRSEIVADEFVFVRCTKTYLCRLHARVREKMELPADFVIHSLRHTMLTRLGEAGVDAFTIMRVAGHGSITVSQRYIHPSSEAMERAFEKLEAANAEGCTERAHEAVDEAAAA
jgi:integrase